MNDDPFNDIPHKPEYKRKDPELGVLLVHGIGHQKRGETLGWAGDPLFRWLEAWLKGDPSRQRERADDGGDRCPMYLTSTSILHPIVDKHGEVPPASRFWFQESEEPSPEDRNWIVAESFWAEEFDPPSFNELVGFGLGFAPILVESTGLEILKRIFNVLWRRLDGIETRRGIFGGFFVRLQRDIVGLASLLFTLLGRFMLGVLGALAQMFIIVLYLVGFFPPLKGMVTKIQLHLAGWLGDAYLVAASPVRYNAMVSKVRRDIDWLLRAQPDRGPCGAVAVIAHSGGAIVAHEALAGAHSERYWSEDYRTTKEPPLLITYGSGHSKEHKIQKLLPKNSFFFGATAVARVLLAVVNLVLLLALLFLTLPVNIFGIEIRVERSALLLAVMGLLILQYGVLTIGRRKMEEMSKGIPFNPRKPEELEWRDFLSTVDIVTDTDIEPKGAPKPITTEVYNLHSLREDHGAYWQNKEEFVADVVCELLDTAKGEDLGGIRDPENVEMLKEAKRRHCNRVNSYFGAGLISVGSLPLLWLSLGSWLPRMGKPFRDAVTKPIESFIDLLGFDGVKLPPSEIWNTIIGATIVALAVFIWHQGVVRRLWNWWTRSEEEDMFKRDLKMPSKEVRRAAAWFMAVSCILPLVPPLLLAVRALLNRPFVQSDAWAVLIVVLSAALFISRFTWVLIARRGLWERPSGTVQPTTGLVEGLIRFLEKLADRKWSGALFIGLVILCMLLTWVLSNILGPAVGAGCQEKTLDTLKRFYTEEEAYGMIKSCTDGGRQAYFWSEVFDLFVYPVVLALTSALGIVLGSRYIGDRISNPKWQNRVRKAKWLVILPLIYLFTDWSENISIMTMILSYPNHILAAEQFAGFITPIKWLVGAVAGLLGAVAGLLGALGGLAAIILLLFSRRRQ